MRKHNVHRARRTSAVPAVKPLPWGSVLLTLICASILAAGLFYAARQHFSTIDLGLKNSKLRKQVDDLESERRRLVLAREVSMSPLQITRNSRELAQRVISQTTPPIAPETVALEKKEPSTSATQPVQISMRETKKIATTERSPSDVKKLANPRSEQTTDRSASPNERPRVVETEKRVASAVVKSF